MAETVNTSALLLSDGQGGYSKAFMESMTDIVKLQNGSSLTEKLAEIDGKLPITLTSGTLPETLGFGKVAFACDSSEKMTILAGKIDESVVEILTSESGVLRYEEVSGETVNPFVVDADTLGGSTKEQIISEAQSGLDLSNIDAATLEGHAANYFATASDMNSCFQSVSSGKTQVANAITGKGVATSSSDTFATMASNINQIKTASSLALGKGTLISTITTRQTTYDIPSNARYGIFTGMYGEYLQCAIIPHLQILISKYNLSVGGDRPMRVYGSGEQVQMAGNARCYVIITFNGTESITVTLGPDTNFKDISWYA